MFLFHILFSKVLIWCWKSHKNLIIEQSTEILIILKNLNFEITYLRLIYTRLEAVKNIFDFVMDQTKNIEKIIEKKIF